MCVYKTVQHGWLVGRSVGQSVNEGGGMPTVGRGAPVRTQKHYSTRTATGYGKNCIINIVFVRSTCDAYHAMWTLSCQCHATDERDKYWLPWKQHPRTAIRHEEVIHSSTKDKVARIQSNKVCGRISNPEWLTRSEIMQSTSFNMEATPL